MIIECHCLAFLQGWNAAADNEHLDSLLERFDKQRLLTTSPVFRMLARYDIQAGYSAFCFMDWKERHSYLM